jgi:hypothetical protein
LHLTAIDVRLEKIMASALKILPYSSNQSSNESSVAQAASATNAYSAAHATQALKWLDTMCAGDQWNLTIDEVTEILGGVAKRTYHDWKRRAALGEPVDLSRDTMERLSLLLGIAKALQLIAPADRPELASAWFSTANNASVFAGKSPKTYIIQQGSLNALYTVRRYLDAARG